jgi:polyferredoxin
MQNLSRNRLLMALVMSLLFAVTPALMATDDTAENLIDSTTIARGEPECTHTTDANKLDSTEQAAIATTTTAVVQTEEIAAVEEEAEPGLSDFLFTEKYYAFAGMMILGMILLFGRWIGRWVRLGAMVLAFVLFGLDYIFPLHPSPMCAMTKLFMFKFTWGEFFPAFVAVFVAIMVPSVIFRKAFCGWVCPLGAMQELIFRIPFVRKFKNFNFTAFNALRLGLLAMFFLTFFWVMDHVTYLAEYLGEDPSERGWVLFSAYNVYDPINFFHILHWNPDTLFYWGFIILFVASLMLYRPFCYAACPVGALTWLLEKIAPGRIRVDHDLCTECGDCFEASPCPTIKPMVEQSMIALPDCTSCGECAGACEEGAISFGFMPKRK